MNVRFFIDPETDLPHILKHGVTEEEAEEVVLDPVEDQRTRGDARIARGKAGSGRFIRVVYSEREDGLLIITAWAMDGNELKAYRRRNRNR